MFWTWEVSVTDLMSATLSDIAAFDLDLVPFFPISIAKVLKRNDLS